MVFYNLLYNNEVFTLPTMLLKRVIPWGEPDLINAKDHIDAILTNFNAFDQRTDQLPRATALCGGLTGGGSLG